MTKLLEWVKETTDYAMGLSFGAMFFAVFGLLMDDLVLGVAFGVLFFIVFSTNEEYEASFDGETLRMADEQSETELDAGNVGMTRGCVRSSRSCKLRFSPASASRAARSTRRARWPRSTSSGRFACGSTPRPGTP